MPSQIATREPVVDVPAPPVARGRAGEYLAVVALAVPLAAHIWMSTTSRYVWDDYCFANELHREGFLGSLVSWYGRWSGRVGHVASMNVAELGGPLSARVIPGLAIVALVAALAWAIRVLAGAGDRRPSVAASLAGAELLVVATLLSAPEIFQSLYWRVGVLEYFTPFVILAVVAGLIGRVASGRAVASLFLLVAVGTATALAGTFSETQVTVQAPCVAMAVLASMRRGEAARRARPALLALFAGTVVAAVVVVAAPGNDVRRAYFPVPPETSSLVRMSFDFAHRFLRESFVRAPLALIVAFVAPFAVALAGSRTRSDRLGALGWLTIAPLAIVAIAVAGVLPSAQGQSAYPVGRALTTPLFALACVLALSGYAAGLVLGRARRGTVRAAASVFHPIVAVVLAVAATTQALTPHRVATSYAALADRRDAQIRSLSTGGASTAVVALLPRRERAWVGGLEIGRDPDWGANRCMAEYYGLDSIVAT